MTLVRPSFVRVSFSFFCIFIKDGTKYWVRIIHKLSHNSSRIRKQEEEFRLSEANELSFPLLSLEVKEKEKEKERQWFIPLVLTRREREREREREEREREREESESERAII